MTEATAKIDFSGISDIGYLFTIGRVAKKNKDEITREAVTGRLRVLLITLEPKNMDKKEKDKAAYESEVIPYNNFKSRIIKEFGHEVL